MTQADAPALTLARAQQIVDDWIGQWEEGYWPPLANLARLSEEVGELAREINATCGPKTRKADRPEGAIAEELGDILFVVATLANQLDVDLDEALRATLRKYDIRDADRWTPRER
jgi:NTP pyrophosphatase (non-canonical NTP hydrolase)